MSQMLSALLLTTRLNETRREVINMNLKTPNHYVLQEKNNFILIGSERGLTFEIEEFLELLDEMESKGYDYMGEVSKYYLFKKVKKTKIK